MDEVDGCADSDEDAYLDEVIQCRVDQSMDFSQNKHGNYKHQLEGDIKVHSDKLDFLFKRRRSLENRISDNKKLLDDLENSEGELDRLRKKLRVCGRRKIKLSQNLQSLKSHLVSLEDLLKDRARPDRDALERTLSISTRSGSFTNNRRGSFTLQRQRSREGSFSSHRPRNGSFSKVQKVSHPKGRLRLNKLNRPQSAGKSIMFI